MGKICTFFCQEDVSLDIEPLIEQQIHKLIMEHNVDTFWLRGSGWFDIYAIGSLKKLKTQYPHIKIILITVKDNSREILLNADFILTYFAQTSSHFLQSVNTRVINLAKIVR